MFNETKSEIIGSSNLKIPACDFTYQMEWMGQPVNDIGYWNWSFFVLKGEDGKYHGFGDRVKETDMPMSTRNPKVRDILYGQMKVAEIAHYISDKPEGPYLFSNVSLPCTIGEISRAKIFPSIQRCDNKWYMMYTYLRGNENYSKGEDMRLCMAVADSLYGPWHDLGTVLEPSSDTANWTYGSKYGVKVGQMLPFRGKWYAYFKTWTKAGDFVGVAVADHPEGPWTITEKPAILKDGEHPKTYLEDLGVFQWKDKVYIMIMDWNPGYSEWNGGVAGISGAVVLFSSDDGLTFPWDHAKLLVDQAKYHCPEYDPVKAVNVWGSPNLFAFDTPRTLLIDGKPSYLYFSNGTNIYGKPASSVYCLKIPEWTI